MPSDRSAAGPTAPPSTAAPEQSPNRLPKAEFAFPGPLRDQLVAAILRGEKISTTGLVLDYEEEGEPVGKPGDRSLVVDSGDRPVAVIQTDSVEVRRLGDVDLRHAIDEGEGYETVAQWREGHERFWRSYRPDLHIDDDLLLVLERFHVVSTEPTAGSTPAADPGGPV